ncbi:MAG: hypothetical protein ACO1QB_13425 [Verrucomicrobiales bacterium]
MLRNAIYLLVVSSCFYQSHSVEAGINLQPNGSIYQSYLRDLPEIDRANGILRLIWPLGNDRKVFVQAESSVSNHTIGTADPFDNLHLWFYANPFLGYIDARSDVLIHVEKLEVLGQTQPIAEAYDRFGVSQIPDDWVYPGTTQKIKGAGAIIYNPDGSILRDEYFSYSYRHGGGVKFPARHYYERENYFYWPDGWYFNEPVTKIRQYPNHVTMIDPVPHDQSTPSHRSAWYEDGRKFFSYRPLYPTGEPMREVNGANTVLLYPPPYHHIKIADQHPGGFIQIRYPNNDVMKQDAAPYSGQLRRTDGTLVTATANSFSFPEGVSVYLAANTNEDFIGIYRDQTNSITAVVQYRRPEDNSRNLRVMVVTENSISLAMDAYSFSTYKLRWGKGKNLEDIYSAGYEELELTGLTPTLNNLQPDTAYILQVIDKLIFPGTGEEYYGWNSFLVNVSTRMKLEMVRSPNLKIRAVSNSPGERYRLEKSANMTDWSIAAPTQFSGEGSSTLEWDLPDQQPQQGFYRVKKLAPFDWE